MKRRIMVPAEKIERIDAMLMQFIKDVESPLKNLRVAFADLLADSVIVERRDAGQSDEAKRRRAMERARKYRAKKIADGLKF